jgi:putative aldouronate transport system substrate-binding protein
VTSVESLELTTNDAEPITLPISEEKITLSYFAMPESYVVSKMKGYSEMTVHQEAEKLTNISINWREESYTDPVPKMNLMFSTGEPEDIIWDAFKASGGAKKLLDDELIVPLNSYIDKYAPNLKKLIEENPELLNQISTDDGRIFMFPELRIDPLTRANSGFQIRKDWLDKLGLKEPTTIDEWYTVLKAFKEQDPNGNGEQDEVPFVSVSRQSTSKCFNNFAVGFGIIDGFYVDNGEVKYAPLESEYKEFISTMAKWYAEGLIDPEYSVQESKNFDAKVTGDIGGAYYAALSGNLGKYINAKEGQDFELEGIATPTAPDGKNYVAVDAYAKLAPHGASIGANNEYIVETVKWLDWHYSDEADNLYNWGIEGQAYEMVNGERAFTKLITENPDGLTLEEAAVKYAGGTVTQMPLKDNGGVFKQLKSLPEQIEASAIWSKSDVSKIIPDLYFSDEKTLENTNILAEVNTYVDEMFNKFIMGIEPLDNYDKFVEQIKSMNMEAVVNNYQESYDTLMK